MAREYELKFDLGPGDPERFASLALVRKAATGPPNRLHLITTYYDTPAFDCRKRGIGFRIRRQNGGWLQSVKTERPGEHGVFVREEVEFPVAAGKLDFERLRATEFWGLFQDPAIRQSLAPLFSTDFIRTIVNLKLSDGTQIEAAVDIGSVQSGVESAPIHELELELKSGNPQSVRAFAKELASWMPLRPSDVSKAARGYTLTSHAG